MLIIFCNGSYKQHEHGINKVEEYQKQASSGG